MLGTVRVWLPILLISLGNLALAACPEGDLTGDCQVDSRYVRAFATQCLFPPRSAGDLDRLTASDLLAAPTVSLVAKRGDFFDLTGIYLNEELTYIVDQATEKAVSAELVETTRTTGRMQFRLRAVKDLPLCRGVGRISRVC